jgi:flagellar biosynthesis component FlhA
MGTATQRCPSEMISLVVGEALVYTVPSLLITYLAVMTLTVISRDPTRFKESQVIRTPIKLAPGPLYVPNRIRIRFKY